MLEKNKIMGDILFITGIGTNVGKSYATGWLANEIKTKGGTVITQKMIQTGNIGTSEDIDIHRKVMNIPYNDDDKSGLTAPIILTYPSSPLLASQIDQKPIDLNIIKEATQKLSSKYDTVIIEGAGGIMVPIKENYLTLDYVKENKYPCAVVVNGALGSINLTLLTIEMLKANKIEIQYIIYNHYFDYDSIITEDTINYIKKYLAQNFKKVVFLEMPSI